MPVLGADPDKQETPWEEHPQARRRPRARPAVQELIDYFCYHPQMKMSQRGEDQDKLILARLFAQRLDAGYTLASLKVMVDRFYQSWGAQSKYPSLAFASKAVQDVLLKEAEVVKDDPILTWMLQGMPDRGPFDDAKAMRKVILLHAGDLPYRYPDAVAAILALEGTPEVTGRRLAAVDALVHYKLGEEDTGPTPDVVNELLGGQLWWDLPLDIRINRSPRKMRPKHDTVHEAIAAVPTKHER